MEAQPSKPHIRDGESSADETTAIVRKNRAGNRIYNTGVRASSAQADRSDEGQTSALTQRRRKSTQDLGTAVRQRGVGQGHEEVEEEQQKEEAAWWKRLADKYGSIELENDKSVARDHLALERTFLAWLRTSLSFASIGIAVTQLFRLNTSLSSSPSPSSLDTEHHPLRRAGKPLGATFLAIAVMVLGIGFHRYFEGQHYLMRGKFPASRAGVVLVSAVAAALMVASLVVVVGVKGAGEVR